MSDLNPIKKKVTIGDRDFELSFNLLTTDTIQSYYDMSINDVVKEKLFDDINGYTCLAYVFTVLANDYVDDYNETHKDQLTNVSQNWVARRIGYQGQRILEVILELLEATMPKKSEFEEEEEIVREEDTP